MTDKQLLQKKAKAERMLSVANDIVEAWTNEGRTPQYHRRCQRRLEKEWPCLAAAIKRLVFEKEK